MVVVIEKVMLHGNILDLLLTNLEDNINNLQIYPDPHLQSDHYMLMGWYINELIQACLEDQITQLIWSGGWNGPMIQCLQIEIIQ